MDKEKIENNIFDISFPIVEQFQCELVGVELIEEDREWYLRVYIDKDGGINIDDCANVSRVLSDKLDEIDPIEFSYYLEVSSPGPNRIIKKDSDFTKFAGKKIKIKFIKPYEHKKYLEGTLKGLEGNTVLIETDGGLYRIDRNITSFIKLNDI
jgi:ribosome maturation factor RimP